MQPSEYQLICVGIIEDNHSFRRNMEYLFEQDEDIKVLFSLPSVEHLVQNRRLHETPPDIILLDIELPGISGADGISIIREIFPKTHLLVLTGNLDEETIWKTTTGGAKGYLLKPIQHAELKAQMLRIQNGETLISPGAASVLVRKLNGVADTRSNPYMHLFTRKEAEVVSYILKGFTYKQIALVMHISITTVNDHQKKIYKKLQINSKYELIAKLMSN